MNRQAPIVLRSGVRDERDGFGHLLTPSTGAFARSAIGYWACDNDCFSGFNTRLFLKMLDKVKKINGCLFVACPDVVGKWLDTLDLFETWQPIIAVHQLPVAIVVQDGVEPTSIPWDRIDAVFIGGTTEFKFSTRAQSITAYSMARGKWVHMGRVNSRRRFNYAWSSGCQSIDGSSFSWFPNTYATNLLKWKSQGRLFCV